jgi:hypothetical protein
MLSVFTLWTFQLPVYESNLKRHLNVDYISLRWYDIPELLFPIKICSHNEWVIASKYLCHRYLGTVPLVVVITPSFMRLWLITVSVTRVTRRILLVEQEMLTLPEHLSSVHNVKTESISYVLNRPSLSISGKSEVAIKTFQWHMQY